LRAFEGLAFAGAEDLAAQPGELALQVDEFAVARLDGRAKRVALALKREVGGGQFGQRRYAPYLAV